MILAPDTPIAEIDALATQVAGSLSTLSHDAVRDGLLEHLAALVSATGLAETRLWSGAGSPRTVDEVEPIEWVLVSTDTSTGESAITSGVGTATGPATLVVSSSPGSQRMVR